MPRRRFLAPLGFGLALLGISLLGEEGFRAVDHAVIWLPTGVAIAGVWLLGARTAWIVAVAIALQRLLIDGSPQVVAFAAMGSTAEALLGVWVLRRTSVRPVFGRLRDVLGLGTAAAVAPLASIAFSWLSRALPGTTYAQPVFTGWIEWWRMNALGVLTVVPLILVWHEWPASRPRLRAVLEAMLLGASVIAVVWFVMTGLQPGIQAIMTLHAIVPIALYAALRFGQRGSISIAALGTLMVGMLGAHSGGAFLDIASAARHGALQVFELTLISIPLVIGSLIAEREARNRRAERVLAWQAEILELVARGRASQDVFGALVSGIEKLLPGGLCSILTLEGRRLRVAAASSLPEAYNACIDGVEIGPDVGSCGTAAHDGRTVVVEDIATDPKWRAYRALAETHGLAACWSVPIVGSAGVVLGTFAIYHRGPRRPTAHEIGLVERAAALAAVGLERERREGLLASINRNANDGLYRVVVGRGIVYANQAFARMFGYASLDDLLARFATADLGASEHDADINRLMTDPDRPQPQEMLFHRRDGSSFWGLVSSSSVISDEGRHTTIDGVVLDVTVRKELEAQLRQAQKMEAVGQLAGGVAHDFNNLLTGIGGFAEMLAARLPAGSEQHSDARQIVLATERAASLTRQLLAFSRQQVLAPRVLELARVVDEFATMLRRLIGENVELVIGRATGRTDIHADRGQIEQILLNVVLNARDAMPHGGVLTITTSTIVVEAKSPAPHAELIPGRYVVLSIRDTGVGMSPEVLARAFDPFFTTKPRGRGTGIGLATVYGIVTQSGGAAKLDSVPGQGTTVWIYLRSVERAREPDEPTAASPTQFMDATVLLVEDEQQVRDFAHRALTGAGLTVLAAPDGEAALELVRRHAGKLDLLVTDVVMPHMDGRELARRLRERIPGLRVLYVSGYAADGEQWAGEGTHDTAYLQKPFGSADLLTQLATLVQRGESLSGRP